MPDEHPLIEWLRLRATDQDPALAAVRALLAEYEAIEALSRYEDATVEDLLDQAEAAHEASREALKPWK